MTKHKLLLGLLIYGSFAWAQQESTAVEPLITDRPDATEAPNLVQRGFLQIETGTFYEEFENGPVTQKAWTLNTMLLRYGLLDNLELRLGWDFQEIRTEIAGTELDNIQSGLQPLLVGAKIGIADRNGFWPQIGLLGHVYLPLSAGQDFRPETTGVDFRFSFDHSLSERSGIAYNIGMQWRDDSPEAAYVYTLAYGYGLTERLGLYAEIYGDLPEDSSPNHSWDAGLTYLVNPDLQLDATIGSGITTDQELLLSAGFSYRIRKW
ncbi:transporter [Croceiramulus getboli]|nr:transporter [Flavobacteriaceae bacterium YJPT1-3]